MPELEVTWQRVARVWWLMFWRTTLGVLLFGFASGFVIGVVGWAVGWSQESIAILGAIAGALAGLVWGLVVVRMALRKQYGEFRVALIPAAS